MNNNKIIINIPGSGSYSLEEAFKRYASIKCYHLIHYPNFDFFKSYQHLFVKLKFKDIFLKFYKNANQEKLNYTNKCHEFYYLNQAHGDICSLDQSLMHAIDKNVLINKKIILQQHFPPTKINKIFLKNFKKVIILREPKKIIKKYKKDKFKKMIIKEIEKDLLKFCKGWSKKDKNSLIIRFDDLIRKPRYNLENIFNFLNIKYKMPSKLSFPHLNKSNLNY